MASESLIQKIGKRLSTSGEAQSPPESNELTSPTTQPQEQSSFSGVNAAKVQQFINTASSDIDYYIDWCEHEIEKRLADVAVLEDTLLQLQRLRRGLQ